MSETKRHKNNCLRSATMKQKTPVLKSKNPVLAAVAKRSKDDLLKYARAFAVNRTRGTVLSERGSVLRNPLRQAIGTMFHKLPGCYVFVFPWQTRVAITNLFVFEPLDILWLDDNGVITHIRERFAPFALHAGTPKPARFVVELPGGTVVSTKTQLGDQISVHGLLSPAPSERPRKLFNTLSKK